MLDAQQLKTGLQHCTGTTQYFKHSLSKLQYTEGIQYLAENAESYWLIDAIASYQYQFAKNQRLQQFQLWRAIRLVEMSNNTQGWLVWLIKAITTKYISG